MAETRIRGQEVTIRISRGAKPERTITAIKDFTIQLDLEKIEEGYLGERSKRKDMIYNGVSGSFSVEMESQELLEFVQNIKERAQRVANVNDERINAVGSFAFPDGTRPKVLIKDMVFGNIPINSPGREAYVSVNFDFSAADASFITT